MGRVKGVRARAVVEVSATHLVVVVEVALVRHAQVREEALRDEVVRVVVRVLDTSGAALGPPHGVGFGLVGLG